MVRYTGIQLILIIYTFLERCCHERLIFVYRLIDLYLYTTARTFKSNQIAALCNPFYEKKNQKVKKERNLIKKMDKSPMTSLIFRNIFPSGYLLNVHLFSSSLYECTCCTNVQSLCISPRGEQCLE
jgi:hypothetical protein